MVLLVEQEHQTIDPWSIFIEPPNLDRRAKDQKAFDPEDTISRYLLLVNELTSQELTQLSEAEEFEALATHVAEIEGLPVTPYQLFTLKGQLGSLRPVKNESGQTRYIFRRLVDMLQSRVDKYPQDQRSHRTLDFFVNQLEPLTAALPEGSGLVFFSPPDKDGDFEYDYGFMYLLQKSGQHLLNGYAVKLDLEINEYFALNRHFRPEADQNTDISNLLIIIDDLISPGQALEIALGPVRTQTASKLRLLDQDIKDPDAFIQSSLSRYQTIKTRLTKEVSRFAAAARTGNQTEVSRLLSQIQLEALKISSPATYLKAQQELSLTGFTQVILPCGLMSFSSGGSLSPVDLIVRGLPITSDDERKIWVCQRCGHRHNIDVDAGKLEPFCKGCGASGKC